MPVIAFCFIAVVDATLRLLDTSYS